MEKLVAEINGIQYQGSYELVKVDKTTFSFNVHYKNLPHEDKSLFKFGREEQALIHINGELNNLVKQHLSTT